MLFNRDYRRHPHSAHDVRMKSFSFRKTWQSAAAKLGSHLMKILLGTLKSPLLHAVLLAGLVAILGLSQLSSLHAATNTTKKSPPPDKEELPPPMGDTINNPGPAKPRSAPGSTSPDGNQTLDQEGKVPPGSQIPKKE